MIQHGVNTLASDREAEPSKHKHYRRAHRLFFGALVTSLISVFAAPSFASPLPFSFPPGFLHQTPAPAPEFDEIPPENNRAVRAWIQFFTVTDRDRFDRFMERGARYRTLVQDILEENDAPVELYYLGMIESGYASRARSRARAVGIWQFMPSTARQYGLRVDNEVDERLDVRRSTRAAAQYLKDLKREFGSWYLAMAAYNCGAGRIRHAVRRGRTHDFWKLAQRHVLPPETTQYIPKFQAAMQIVRAPLRYGFDHKIHYEFPEVMKVRFPASVHLQEIARRHGVSIAALRILNPQLLRERTPHNRHGYEVWIPRPRLARTQASRDD